MNIFLYVSSIFFAMLALGFLIGFVRNWCRSLIRLGILIGDFLISLFISPLISNAVIGKVTTGSTINIFGLSFDITEYLNQIFGNDLDGVIDTSTAMGMALVKVALNIILFMALFIIIGIVSLIIYWVALLIYKKLNKKEASNDTKLQKSIGFRFLGGFEGMLTMFVLCFVFLVPFFGTFEIMDKAVANSTTQETTASALNGSNFVCGELYYTDDEKIGQVESYIEQYSIYKKKYDASFMGRVFKFTGVNKLGNSSFRKLSKVQVDGENVEFASEITIVIETYDLYKDTFVKNKFDINSENSIESLEKIYDKMTSSTFVKKFVVDIIPTMAEKWSNGETFLNMSSPVSEQYQPILNDVLNVFASKNFGVVNDNVKALFEVAKIARDEKLISSVMEKQNLLDYLKSNSGIVEEILLELTKTQEFKNNLPNIFADGLDIAYKTLVGDENFDKTISSTSADVNWEEESKTISNLVNSLIEVYDKFNLGQEKSLTEEEVYSNLDFVGRAIDFARNSKTINEPLKSFIVGYISSDKLDLGKSQETLKSTILNMINDKWSVEQNPDFSFEHTLATLGETASIAEALSNGNEIDLENFKKSIENVLLDEDAKTILLDFVSDGLIYDMIGISNQSYVLNNLLDALISNSTLKSLSSDIEASKSFLDILNTQKETVISNEKANEMVSNISNSSVILDLISNLADDESKPLSELTQNMSESNKSIISENVINSETLSESQKDAILSIFA